MLIDKLKLALPNWLLNFARWSLAHLSKLHFFVKASFVQTLLNARIRKIRRNSNRPINVAFLVVYDMVFQFEHVFELMKKDASFVPQIIIIPDVSRGQTNMKNQMDHSFIALNKKYPGDVIRADSSADGTFVDLSNKYDIFFLMNPYSAMTHRFYTFAYLARKGQLIVYTHYAVGEGTANSKHFDQLKEMQYLWRFYLERPSEYIRFKKSQPILSLFHRLSVVGAVKTDLLGCQKVQTRNRNRIILAPHHSVPKNNTPLSIGNFNRYASFFLNLPERYPNIDWVFRPHPLLFWTMINLGYWTTSDAENYMKKMMSYSNVEYQTSSEYHEAFVNSDALIQDSGSFIAEYHLTGHPQCYLLRDDKILETQFNTFGRKMLKHTYKAYSENQITHFIDTVVVKGQDNMISSRMDFVEKELKVNFLHASEAIIKDIKNELLNSHEA